MKSGKKPLTKNLLYSTYILADEEIVENIPIYCKDNLNPFAKCAIGWISGPSRVAEKH